MAPVSSTPTSAVPALHETPIALPQDDQPARITIVSRPPTPAPPVEPVVAVAYQAPQQPIRPPSPAFTPAPTKPTLQWNSNTAPVVVRPSPVIAGAAVAPSYPALAAGSPAPRVRMPSYATPAGYTQPITPTANAQMHVNGSMQITELPPLSTVSYQPATQHDGFQPRGSIVRRPPQAMTPTVN